MLTCNVQGVYMIHGFEGMSNATKVCDGIYYGGSDEGIAIVESGKGAASDFRFFFKYTAWAPGQLEAEMQAGCWCPVKTSLDMVLKPRVYPGLQVAQYHKVFWHQVRCVNNPTCSPPSSLSRLNPPFKRTH